MKVLVLGDSDSSGAFGGGLTWSGVLRTRLAEQLDGDVDLTEVRFGPLNPTAGTFAEQRVRELQPDLVVLPVSAYLFGMGFTWKRVERLFGKRAARWYRRLEAGFDANTRRRGSVGDRANLYARMAIRRLVGVQPLATRAATERAYAGVMQALARLEDTQVLAVSYGGRTAYNRDPRVAAERRAFLAVIEAAATTHRFPFFDGSDAYADVPLDVPITTADGLHTNDLGHELLGNFIADHAAKLLAVPA